MENIQEDRSTILCVSISAAGHVNTVLGIANELKQRNHRVVFVTDKRCKGKFEKFGIEEELYDENEIVGKRESDFLSDAFSESLTEVLRKPIIERLASLFNIIKSFVELSNALYETHVEIVSRVKPNIIIVDSLVPFPGLLTANKPIIFVCSTSPLIAIDDDRLPPFALGLPLEDKRESEKQRKVLIEYRKPLWLEINKKLEEYNLPALREYRLQHVSTNLNVYVYPKPLMDDYLRLCPLGDEWFGLDHSIRPSEEKFQLPPNFKNEGEKLIYLSLVGLMSRLVKFLAKCKHKIIVVTGQNHAKYELAENMWGAPFLPQLQILPLVDLVITHGGNNTFIESLYFGKPMIIFPLLADQPDNAQRA
ncbi:glycosyl transferase-like protein, partial [Dinothrombium tinctorium]